MKKIACILLLENIEKMLYAIVSFFGIIWEKENDENGKDIKM